MAKGLGLLGTGLKTKEQALKGLRQAAAEEARTDAMQEQLDAQMKAAEMSQMATLTAIGGAAGAAGYGAKLGVAAGPWGAVIGAAAGFLFSKIF